MDEFTQHHLRSWAELYLWLDEVEPFMAWMEALDLDDQEHYGHAGWPVARDAWRASLT